MLVSRGAAGMAVAAAGHGGFERDSDVRVSRRAPFFVALVSLLVLVAVFLAVSAWRPGMVASRHASATGQGLSSLPLALRGPASATLGADQHGYGASAAVGGFTMHNPAQRLGSQFDATGVQISSGAARVKLSLQSVGYGSTLRSLPAVKPHARDNRVSYAYGGLSAWYANGPLGLEQGFTIARPLARSVGGAFTVALAVGDGVRVSLARGGRSARFGRAGGPSLRYSGLSATDARGHTLPSWLEVHHGQLLLRVQARGAVYPLHIDPFIQPGEKLPGGSEEIGEGEFGISVALSADGNTAVIGGGGDNRGAGAAWVFTRSGSTWTQQGPKLTGGSEEISKGDFGFSVALSADGNTALIGAYADNGETGAAWVFTRTRRLTWLRQGPKLTGGEEVEEEGSFGASVALSADGNTALVGGPTDRINRGAAWVFTRSGSTWTQQGPKLTGGSDEIGEGHFGCCEVALSGDGNTALIGAYADNGEVGAAWVFTRSGSTWTQQGPKLTGGSEEIGAAVFGIAVTISADGNTALIGGGDDNEKVGAAWVFTRSGSTWTQQGPKLTGGGEEIGKGHFGCCGVALSEDGDTALIGAWGDNGDAGAAWVFARSGSTWTQQGPKLTGGSEEIGEGQYGHSVALSAEADTALIGGWGEDHYQGAVRAFENTTGPRPQVSKVAPKLGPTTGGTAVRITGSNLAEASAVSFGSVEAASFTVNSATSITALSPEEPAGKVDITVTTPRGGVSLPTSKDTYKFAPTITALGPNTGPNAGGTSVTVTGTGFGLGTKATVFKFGTTRASSVNCVSSTECTLVSPAHAAGKVVVKATVNKVSSLKGAGDLFTYE